MNNDNWPGGNNQSQGSGAWPGQTSPDWPGQPPNPTWSGAGGGIWPNQPSNPSWPPSQPSAPGGWTAGPTTQQNPSVPFTQKLPHGVSDKLLITIAGTVKPNAVKFAVDLCASSDIVFHFNPRFNDEGRRVIVRNSCIAQQWGLEERDQPNFPFELGKQFEIKILCTNTEFKVAVNNSHLLTFRHRITNLSSIDSIGIYEDVTLSRVTMETLP